MSDDQLAAAAAALNAPEAIVKRSAEARAKADGIPVEQVLAAWAGGESIPETEDGKRKTEEEPEATEPEVPTAVPTDEPAEEVASPQSEPAPVEAPAATPAVPAVPAAAAVAVEVPDLPPLPETVSPAAAMGYPEVVTVPTVGIKERTG
ncbi:MAG TPA: hypothetical protein VHM94_09620, partial [Acidimicrobiia bacterium]|nr:hypothetical protein [Acidimicrobiia bacterium]